MFTNQTVWVSIIIISMVVVLWIIFKSGDVVETSDESIVTESKHKNKKKHNKKNIEKSSHVNNQINDHEISNHHVIDEQYQTPNTTRSISIKQIRCDVSEIKNPSSIIDLIEQNSITYPVRIRRAKDILRPIDLTEPDIIATAPEHVLAICQKLTKEYDIQDDIVVQQIPENQKEYILSCTNGVIDKMYQVHFDTQNKHIVEDISLKNLSIDNKKYLRKILYLQHKKIGRVKGTFDVGFFCSHPSIGFDFKDSQDDDTHTQKNTITIVGMSVGPGPIVQTFDGDTNHRAELTCGRAELISYPYIES